MVTHYNQRLLLIAGNSVGCPAAFSHACAVLGPDDAGRAHLPVHRPALHSGLWNRLCERQGHGMIVN